MCNIYQSPQFNATVLSGNNFFPQISARTGICICAYMHATFLVVEIVVRFLSQALYG